MSAGPGGCSRLDRVFPLRSVGSGLCPAAAACPPQEKGTSWPPDPRGAEPPGQPGFGIQTCVEEHKEALYAAAIATLDFSFIPKHEPSSQS